MPSRKKSNARPKRGSAAVLIDTATVEDEADSTPNPTAAINTPVSEEPPISSATSTSTTTNDQLVKTIESLAGTVKSIQEQQNSFAMFLAGQSLASNSTVYPARQMSNYTLATANKNFTVPIYQPQSPDLTATNVLPPQMPSPFNTVLYDGHAMPQASTSRALISNPTIMPLPNPGLGVAHASSSYHHPGSFGVPMSSLHRIETVPEPICRAIVEGKDVNLSVLLMSADYLSAKCYSGKTNKAEKNYEKLMTDPRAYRDISLPEFIRAFTIYKNVMCGTYPERRSELDQYERDVVDMGAKFPAPLFYHYHKDFATKAAAYPQQRNVKSWSLRDESLCLEIFAGHFKACVWCQANSHTSE